jgi:hypothetical protein
MTRPGNAANRSEAPRRETAEILADPAALRGLAEAREAEQAGDVVYGTEAARALLTERKQ